MRKNAFKVLLRELRSRLKLISDRDIAQVEKFSGMLAEISGFLKQVKEQVMVAGFGSELEEIYFFKFEKPEFYALQVYHVALFALLQGRPMGVPELLRGYYLDELRFIDRFFKQNAFLYGYYRSGFTEMDGLLFVRGAEVGFPLLQELPVLDGEFDTAGDYFFAKFMAYEDLRDYILERLNELDARQEPAALATGPARFEWSGEVINLVELGYGIWLSGQLGKGTGLGEIFLWLEQTFGVDIGIPANRFREIKRRKRLSRTRFFDLCKDRLTEYMDQDDAYRPDGISGKINML
ncbi:RteC domain-containing protein [Pedobacter sp. GSP4]|uniref:RteC domain-containing protein n=1 Tax=Pedobacter sp. GSP4 TaxID=3453716 RepID=UPI003EEF7206